MNIYEPDFYISDPTAERFADLEAAARSAREIRENAHAALRSFPANDLDLLKDFEFCDLYFDLWLEELI